jgi:hypothetical protein
VPRADTETRMQQETGATQSSELDGWLRLTSEEFRQKIGELRAYGDSLHGKRKAQRAIHETVSVLEQLYREQSRAGQRPGGGQQPGGAGV